MPATRNLRALALVLALAVGNASAQTLCGQYQALIKRSAFRTFGPDAPVATLTAQLHQESACNPNARSRAGAQGLSQFMPATAADMAARHADVCSPAQPFSAQWAITCRDRYMRDLLRQYSGNSATESDAWAFALSAYNGGAGWVARDKLVCTHSPPLTCPVCDASRWWGNVEVSADPRRSAANVRENKHYPRRIICELSPRYEAAGWGRAITCGEAGWTQ